MPVVLALNPVPLTVNVELTVPLAVDKVIAGAAMTSPVINTSRSNDNETEQTNLWNTLLYFTCSPILLYSEAYGNHLFLSTSNLDGIHNKTPKRAISRLKHANKFPS